MEYRQLGRSGLRISALTLGTMTFGGRGGFGAVGATDVTGARRQVDICVDAGVNLIDTADVYSGGFAEEITGEVITGRRDSLLLSTKVRMTMGADPNDAGLSRQHIIAGCEASLRRLGTDHIDIYHVHEWDGQTRLEETMSALNSLVDAGKVRYLAASNYAGWQLMKALSVADAHGYERFAAQQVYYSLEARDAEFELVPLAVDQGLGILIWSPLAGGLLSGKYRRNASPSDGTRQLSGTWHEPPVRDQEKLYDTIDVLVDIAAARGVSPAQVALAWLLGRPAVTSVIIGARTDEQLRDNLGAAELALAADERAALDKVSAPALVYPHWHQLATASDRLGPADLALLGQHLRSE
jgi:aryl-alcohol dehydrogenase-like predicted oxidoreductase